MSSVAKKARSSRPGTVLPAELCLSVLGYRDEDVENSWVALALEMDLRGYGNTFEEALKELDELVHLQVCFAGFKNQPELLWKPADLKWIRLFESVREAQLKSLAVSKPSQKKRPAWSEYRASGISVSAPSRRHSSSRMAFAPA